MTKDHSQSCCPLAFPCLPSQPNAHLNDCFFLFSSKTNTAASSSRKPFLIFSSSTSSSSSFSSSFWLLFHYILSFPCWHRFDPEQALVEGTKALAGIRGGGVVGHACCPWFWCHGFKPLIRVLAYSHTTHRLPQVRGNFPLSLSLPRELPTSRL